MLPTVDMKFITQFINYIFIGELIKVICQDPNLNIYFGISYSVKCASDTFLAVS